MTDTYKLDTPMNDGLATRKLSTDQADSAKAAFQSQGVTAERNAVSVDKPASSASMRAKEFFSIFISKVGRIELSVSLTVATIVLAAHVAIRSYGIETYPFLGGSMNSQFLLTILAMIIIAEIVFLVVKHRPSSPFEFFTSHDAIRQTISRLLPAIVLAICLGFFMSTFSQTKSSIPAFTEYTWDATFIKWDKSMHGNDPWRILQPALNHPAITAALGRLYHLWFVLIHLGPLCIALYVPDKQLKLRFFLGYFLTWTIVGMVSAVGLASVGPVFLQPLIGDPYYAEQMAYLHSANAVVTNPVIEVQQKLLEWYAEGDYGLGRGITAMPSMHVALATLYVFAMWKIDRRLGIAFAVFLLLIMIGSVHLAYHYAVDGYVAFVMVTAIWLATKPVARFILRPRDTARAELNV